VQQDLCNGTGVRLSVCPSCRLLQQRAGSLLLWAWLEGDIARLLHGRRQAATAPQQHGGQQQRREVFHFQPP